VVVFGERFRFGNLGLGMVAIAAVVITWGVIGLSRRTAAEESSAAHASAEAAEAEPDRKPNPEAEPTPH